MTTDTRNGARSRILHVIIMLGETNGQYNEHCLPLMHERDISIVTYFVPQLTPPPAITLFPGDGTLRGFFRALRAALERGGYDVIHVHAPQTGGLVTLATLGRGRFRAVRRSLVYTVQDSFHDYRARDRLLMVLCLLSFRRVVFCSRSALESVPGPLARAIRDRARVVPNGFDLDRVDRAIADRPGPRSSGFTVISVGRLQPVKDPSSVVDAFAAALGDDRTARLVFVGAGPLAGSIAARAQALGVGDRVELTGLIPRDEVYRLCADADVFISASHGEGLPVAVLEAMAARCPAILSDIPPHREVADGSDLIRFVREGDVEGFAEGLRRIRALTPQERRALGDRGREHVAARFTLSVMRAGTDAVYREVGPQRTDLVGRP
ncbi:MAG TPA: glycosyltransferase family 4 protein [Actinomycetota bacterium]|nr:glycosyltransferase family 4 protein [Actinomycetota bacterium]